MGGGGFGRSRRILAAGAALALMGCYTYTPTPPSAAPPGSDVRIHVSRSASLTVGEVPLPESGVVRGQLVEAPSAETLMCSVLLETGLPGSPSRGLRGTVSIPLDDVEELEVRRLDRVRTFSLVGVGTVLAAIIVDAAFDVRNSKEGTDESGGTDNAVITLFRIGW